MNLTDLVTALDGLTYYLDNDGEQRSLQLLPGLSAEEIARIEAMLPCPLPPELRALVTRTAGIIASDSASMGSPADGVCASLDELRFLGTSDGPYRAGFAFPCICWPVLAPDGCGNFWTVDLVPGSRTWGPVYYICHDPATVVYQARDLAEFIGQLRELLTDQDGHSPIARVHDDSVFDIYRGKSATLTHAQLLAADESARSFATRLGPDYTYVDLRAAALGDGVNLHHEPTHRHGDERLFAYKTPVSLWNRLFRRRATQTSPTLSPQG